MVVAAKKLESGVLRAIDAATSLHPPARRLWTAYCGRAEVFAEERRGLRVASGEVGSSAPVQRLLFGYPADMSTTRFDAVVVGAGSTGAAAAAMLAASGRRVALVERRRLDVAGARWINDIPPWLFDEAGVARPEPPERRCACVPITMLDRAGRPRVQLERPMWGVDMRALGQRLRDDAERHGVATYAQARLLELEHRGSGHEERPAALELEQGDRRVRLEAPLFVDASGLAGELRVRSRALSRRCPPVAGGDLVSAAQQVCTIADRDGARAFLARHGDRDGVLTWSGVGGGFSTLGVRVEFDHDEVELLTGVEATHPSLDGPGLIQEFKRTAKWVGSVVFGGASMIPVRRPYDRLAAPGLALVGDAACQTFPGHGSGVGSGLLAARTLERAVAQRDDPGAGASMADYQTRFHRERGGVHAAYDVIRRLARSLGEHDVDRLLTSGLVTAEATRAALLQQMPPLGPRVVADMARAAVDVPALAARFAAAGPRMVLAERAYALHPGGTDERALDVWARRAAWLAGHAADPQP